jgi:hypothetical protein
MNRRNFFRTILGGAALALVPTWLVAKPKPRWDDFTIEFQMWRDPFSTKRKLLSDIALTSTTGPFPDPLSDTEIPLIRDDQWHTYMATRENGKLTWYIDGVYYG